MPDFRSLARVSDVPKGHGRTISVGDKKIALFNVEGTFYAIDDTCVHRGGPLGEGELVDCVVVCPWHGWRYDLRTGEMTLNRSVRINCYSTRVEGDEVQVCC